MLYFLAYGIHVLVSLKSLLCYYMMMLATFLLLFFCEGMVMVNGRKF